MFEWLVGKKREQKSSGSLTHISGQEVLEMIQSGIKLTILDVREQHEFRAGHIKGAQLIPLMQLSKRVHELRTDHLIITVCRSGNRSAQAARLLRGHGFDVRNMHGGMLRWPGKVAK
ncbi:MAG: rhodanese-like domain-containing protein [Sulfobacillus sp.]